MEMSKVDSETLAALDELQLKYDIHYNYTHNMEYTVIDLGKMRIALCAYGSIYNCEICSNYFTKYQIINALRVYIIANELNWNGRSLRIKNIDEIKIYYADPILDEIYAEDFICAKEAELAEFEEKCIFSKTKYQERYSRIKEYRNKIYSKVKYLNDKQKQVVMYK